MKQVAISVVAVVLHAATGSADTYKGTCDASAAVLIEDSHFVLATDEGNDLRLYRNGIAQPAQVFDFYEHLVTNRNDEDSESDLEGATRIDDTIFWLGSHSRSKTGKLRTHRHKLFAMTLTKDGTTWRATPVGKAYGALASDLTDSKELASLKLADTIRLDQPGKIDKLAPKKEGLSLEGLAADRDGSLLVGVRNPLAPDKRAILIRVTNPIDVVTKGERAKFGEPILLDLGGLGIRSIEYVKGAKSFYLLAGPKADGEVFLYRWSGAAQDKPVRLRGFGADASAEGLAPNADATQLLVIFDAGETLVGGAECKDLTDSDGKSFTTTWESVSSN